MSSPQAAIEIGSTGIRLIVAEMHEDVASQAYYVILDHSELPVPLGRDVFTTGIISRDTMLLCIKILRRFSEQIASWQLSPSQTMVLATSAVREAGNRDPFVDRIRVKTGFFVHVIDGIEENRLMYIAVSSSLRKAQIDSSKEDSVILEIAGGATEMILMHKGQMSGAHSLRLGTVIIEQQLRQIDGTLEDVRKYIEEFVQNMETSLNREIKLPNVEQFIAVGGDMKIAAMQCGKQISPVLWSITRDDFESFVEKVLHYPQAIVADKFKLNYTDSQTFQISLIAYRQFLSFTKATSVLVPTTSLREGLLLRDLALRAALRTALRTNSGTAQEGNSLQQEFNAQILASANALLYKYQGDVKHAEWVRSSSLKIYDAMSEELGLTDHIRLLLEVSAILHDIGMFIQAKNHAQHSKYIIQNSEIFGLSLEDLDIVALIALHHNGKSVLLEDKEFKLLPRTSRMAILKLCAILRVADALDHSHRQHIKDFSVSLTSDTLTLKVQGKTHFRREKQALKEKGDLFESVFGYKIVIL